MKRSQLHRKMLGVVSQYQSVCTTQTLNQFASSHNISADKLAYWISKFNKKEVATNSDFAMVNISSPPSIETPKSPITIHLPNGTTIEIPQ